MKVVGIMLISALLILPAVAALQVARGFRMAIALSVSLAIASVLGGIVFSFILNLPTGATIIIINFILFAVTYTLRKLRS
jgi:zinc transport system permease protein